MNGRLGAVLGAALLLATGLTGAAPLNAAQQPDPVIQVRAGVHPDRDRLVFNWPDGAVDYTVAQQGDTVQITFSRRGKADFTAVQRAKLRNVPTVGQATVDGRLVVQITIPPGSEIKHFRSGSGAIAIDVVNPPKNGAAAIRAAGPSAGTCTGVTYPHPHSRATGTVSGQTAGAGKAADIAEAGSDPTGGCGSGSPGNGPSPEHGGTGPAAILRVTPGPVASQPLNASHPKCTVAASRWMLRTGRRRCLYPRRLPNVVFGRPLELDGRIKVIRRCPDWAGLKPCPCAAPPLSAWPCPKAWNQR